MIVSPSLCEDVLACPLLGADALGAPETEAARVAALSTGSYVWDPNDNSNKEDDNGINICFDTQDEDTAETLVVELDAAFESNENNRR